ncbi:hypothetical protein HMPREF9120_02687 [Neisseria sp. oral taxon 020 str. F0370]|nr:hypothetical protein HMPREF9120_02687 [Neisseria sp. oral taxon 020 str. F0370]
MAFFCPVKQIQTDTNIILLCFRIFTYSGVWRPSERQRPSENLFWAFRRPLA